MENSSEASPEIVRVVENFLKENTEPTLYDFVAKHFEFIVQHTPDDCVPSKFWSDIFSRHAISLNIEIGKTKNRINWKKVVQKKGSLLSSTSTNITPTTNTSLDNNNNNGTTFPATNNNNTMTTPSTSSNSNSNINFSSSLGKRSRSSSAKTNSYELTQDMKEEFKRSFEALNDEKKWVLSDGTKVEDVMYEYGAQCTHEHPVHSFILDVEDKCWKTIFTQSQLQELKSTGKKAFCDYNDSCKNMFSAFSEVIKDANKGKLVSGAAAATTTTTNPSYLELTIKEERLIDELWERLSQFGPINPRKSYDLHWLQKTMDDILDLYRFRILDWVKKNGSEMDFVTRIWIMLDKVFDDLIIETRRDNKSVATTFIDNKDRRVTGTTAIAPKLPSTRPGLVLFKNGVEYGVAECGKGDDESSLHCPKIMKSKFLHAASKCNNDESVTRSLKVVGFSQCELRMKFLVMDNPDGYVCRIRTTPEYEISTTPSHMTSGLLPILKLTLKSKLTVQSSIKLVQEYLATAENEEPDVQCEMHENRARLLLPRLQKSPNKKQKC